MLQFCKTCNVTYDDVDHWTFCPHDYFEKPADTLQRLEALVAFTAIYTIWWGMSPKQYLKKEFAESYREAR